MLLTRNAIGNLINRYRAVLKKCHLINTFGSLAVATMLVMGGAGLAVAGNVSIDSTSSADWNQEAIDKDYLGSVTVTGAEVSTDAPVGADKTAISKFVNLDITGVGTAAAKVKIYTPGGVVSLGDTNISGANSTYTGSLEVMTAYTTNNLDVREFGVVSVDGGEMTINGAIVNAGTVKVTNDGEINLSSASQLRQLAAGIVSIDGTTSRSYGNIKVKDDLVINDTDGFRVAETASKGIIGIGQSGSLDANNITIDLASLTLAGNYSRIRAEGTMDIKRDMAVSNAKLTVNARNMPGVLSGGTITLNTGGVMRFGHKDDKGMGGSINADIIVNHDTANVEVEGGHWELGADNTIDVQSGYLSISSLDNKVTATLDASKGTLNSAEAGSIDTTGSEPVGKTGIVVFEKGMLIANKANLLKDDFTKSGDIGQIYVADGGLLQIKGISEITLENATKVKDALFAAGSTGLIDYSGATVTNPGGAEINDSTAKNVGAVINADIKAVNPADIQGGYGANSITTGTATNGTMKSGTVTLLGNSAGHIVTTAAGAPVTTLTLGVDGISGATLNLGTAVNPGNVNTTTNIEMADDASEVNATNGNYKVGDITGGQGTVSSTNGATLTAGKVEVGRVSADNGTINAGAVKVTQGGASFTNGAQANLDSLTLENSDLGVTVGNSDDVKGGTTVTINKMSLGGQMLLIDPPFATGANSSMVAIGSLSDNDSMTTDGQIGVGTNSMLVLGTRDANWLESVVKEATNGAGLTANGVTAALAIYKPLTIGQNNQQSLKILVDGSLDNAGLYDQLSQQQAGNIKDVTFEENSLLVINGKEINGNKVAISGENPLTGYVAPNSKLHIVNAKVKKTYQVFANVSTITGLGPDDTGWTGENVTTDDMMVAIARDTTSTLGVYKTSLVGAKKVMPDIDSELAGLIDAGYLNDKLGGDLAYTGKGGQKFLTRLTHRDFMRGGRDAARVVEGAARIISIGGVQQMALAANNAAGGAVVNRTSIGSLNTGLISVDSQGKVQENAEGEMSGANAGDTMTGANAGGFNRSGFGMWIMPLWQSVNHFGLKGGDFKADLSGSLGGVALGADYTIDDMVRLGLTFNIGGGYAQGSGDFATTKNNMNFWGIGAYASYAQNNMGLTFDINYTSTFNKLKQEMDNRMAMGDLKTDLFAQVLTLGLRGEYKFQLDALDILPHVAVRYTNLWTDDYDVKSNHEKVIKGDGSNQSIWTFPIGIQFSKDIMTSNNWYVRPSLDLSVIPAAGDIEARNDIRFTGVSGEAGLKTQVMDYISYAGQAGIEFGNENIKVGVNYNLQVGAHTTNHGVFGTFRYEF